MSGFGRRTTALSERAPGGGEIRSLNTIRGVAALAVAIYHAPLLMGVSQALPHAYLAVDLFFVLSGFVLWHAYEARLAAGLTLERFFQLRLARLYPLLLLATLAGVAIMALKHAAGHAEFGLSTLAALPLNLVLVPAPAGASELHAAYPFVTQSWSIAWEILLCPLLFVWARRARHGAALIAGAFALALFALAKSRGGLDGGWTADSFWIGGLRALVAFWAGVAVRQWTRGRAAPRWFNMVAFVIGAEVVAYVVFVRETYWLADYAAAVIGFPMVIAAASMSRHPLLENALGDRLGEASYGVYMLHNLTLDVLITALKHVGPIAPIARAALSAGWLVGLVILAWLSWRHVETPLRHAFSRPDLLGCTAEPLPVAAAQQLS